MSKTNFAGLCEELSTKFPLKPLKVKGFQGEARFLSNFYPSPLPHDGLMYPTVEHAYQAAKTLSFRTRYEIGKIPTPGRAKRAGQEVTLRPDWEEVKELIMMELVVSKFVTHRHLGDQLRATEQAELIEVNTWGDTYWGVCNGKGQNVLGKILMLVRDRLS